MTNLPKEKEAITTEPTVKDKSYIVAGYRLSDIASPDVVKKQFEDIQEITGKVVPKIVQIHNLSVFGVSISLPPDAVFGDASDPNHWVKSLFGLRCFFSERSDKEAKGILRFNFRTIIAGIFVCSNEFGNHVICNPNSGSIDYRGKERICKIPDAAPYLQTAKRIFCGNCERLKIKIPDKFIEPAVFLI